MSSLFIKDLSTGGRLGESGSVAAKKLLTPVPAKTTLVARWDPFNCQICYFPPFPRDRDNTIRRVKTNCENHLHHPFAAWWRR